MSTADVLVDQGVDAALSGERTTVSVAVPDLAAPRAETADDDRYGLYLEDLDFGRPGVYFEVYANLPEGTEPDPAGSYYVGNLGHFGPEGAKVRVGFPITELVARLRSQAGWSGDLQLTFVRRGLEGEGTTAETAEAPVRFSRVRVVRE